MPSGAGDAGTKSSHRSTVQREPSDEYDDYDDQYVDDTYPSPRDAPQQKPSQVLDDDLPDTTMLDSVILPAIASVSASISFTGFFCTG